MLPPNQNGFVQIILGHVTLFTVQTTGIGCNRYCLPLKIWTPWKTSRNVFRGNGRQTELRTLMNSCQQWVIYRNIFFIRQKERCGELRHLQSWVNKCNTLIVRLYNYGVCLCVKGKRSRYLNLHVNDSQVSK